MEENPEIRPWVLKKIVLPQNTDHAGVMWHGSYVSWLEEARINALYKVGLKYNELSNDGYELPVVDLQIRYIMPILHGDKVFLESRFCGEKGVRLIFETKFIIDSRKTAAFAKVHLVLIQRKNAVNQLIRKRPIKLSKALKKLQKGPTLANDDS